jgi:hypothetical protein
MATKPPQEPQIFERMAASAYRRRPTITTLRSQAKDALREDEGIDFGPLSHSERNHILFCI